MADQTVRIENWEPTTSKEWVALQLWEYCRQFQQKPKSVKEALDLFIRCREAAHGYPTED